MSKGTVVVSARDMGAESVTRPIAEKARDDGFEVGIIVEGIAGPRFVKAGFVPDFMGTEKFFEVPFTFDVFAYLQKRFAKNKKGVLVIGESGPTNLEEKLALAAAALNVGGYQIQIVVCQDYWGGAGILMPKVRPHKVLTNDEYARDLALLVYAYLNENDVKIVGNPGAKTVRISEKTQKTYDDLRKKNEKIFFFAGGREGHTEKELVLLKQCLEMTDGSLVLVAGYHPTVVKTHGDIWRAIVKPLGKRVLESEPGTGDEWATLAHITLSGHSTCMTTAVWAGKIAAVLWSEEGKKILEKRGIAMTPIASLGCAHVIKQNSPINLNRIERPYPENLVKLKPYDANAAWQAVKELFEK